jgi:tetraacyldisaccharide 4'-kinase
VGEERIVAIPQLLHDKPDLQAIILDDAFQHRVVRAGLNIILTQYGDLYTRDFFMPTGDLRDQRASASRADIIVVTKCPNELDEEEKKEIIAEINPKAHQIVFFTAIEYAVPYHIISHEQRILSVDDEVLLVCGIANPKPLKQYLSEHTETYYQLDYSDHHIFRIDDLRDIQKKFEAITAKQKLIITTEKDAVRLLKFSEQLQQMPVYVVPVCHKFLFNEGRQFDEAIINFITNFKMTSIEE